MLWLIASSAIAGFLIGLRYRVPAVVAAAAVLAIAVAVGGAILKLGFPATLGLVALAILCLQSGYLGGALLAGRWQGVKSLAACSPPAAERDRPV